MVYIERLLGIFVGKNIELNMIIFVGVTNE